MKRALGLVGLLMVVAAVGCGDDGEGTGGGGTTANGQVNPTVAKSSTSQTVTGAKTAIGGDGISAAYQLSGLGTSALAMVGPTSGQQQPQSEGQAKQAVQTGTCDCTETQCTFVGCSDDTYVNAFTIDGNISWANGNVVADLTYSGAAQGATYSFHVVMDVTVTETTIDGTVSTDGSVDTAGYSTTWDSTIVMNDVTFNATGCPTAGSIDVDATVDGAGAGGDYTASESITFDGTGC